MFLVNSRYPLACAPHAWLAPGRGPLLPKLRGQFAEFLQHRSLKRLGILYQSTCVGFGYGLYGWSYFLEVPGRPPNPIRENSFRPSSLPARLGNINPIPIDYGFRPRLRGRLTLRGLTLRRNPWTFGDRVSHTVYRYSCQHSHFRYLQHTSRYTFTGLRNAPLPRALACTPAASVHGLSPVTFSAQDGLSRPVSYYAFFKGWLLLSQPPGCLGLPTSFPT